MAKFCPECGIATIKIQDGTKQVDACPAGHYIQVSETAVGVGALIFYEDTVLLVERILPKGLWALPSGWMNYGETLAQAIVREVAEETSLNVEALGILAVASRSTEIRNELYITVLCKLVSGYPKADEHEIMQARFVQVDELASLNLSPLDKRLIEAYLTAKPKPMQLEKPLEQLPTVTVFSLANGV